MFLLIPTQENRTTFSGSLVADRYEQVKTLVCEFVPRLAARVTCIDSMTLKSLNGFGMDVAGRPAASAYGLVFPFPELVDKRFSHDRSTRIAST
jgi:hypothetical protein